MCPVYLGLARMTRTFCAVQPGRRVGRRVGGGVGVEPGGDGRAAELVDGPPGVDLRDDRGAGRVEDEPGFGAALGGLERDRVRDPLGGVPVGAGCRCSTRPGNARLSPFQIFSLSWSRYHSATPCLTRRTRTVVALTPSMSAGSSVANSGMPCRDSSFSSFSALNMSRPDRSMSSQITAANRGAGAAASASRSAMPPSRGSPAPANCCQAWPWLRCFQVEAAGLDVPVTRRR